MSNLQAFRFGWSLTGGSTVLPDSRIFEWPWKMVSASVCYLFYQRTDEKIKTGTLFFPAKENPNVEKALFDWPTVLQYDVKIVSTDFKKFLGHEVFWSNVLFDRPVALRGHVTNASFKRCVGILLIPKIDRAHKNYLSPEIWEGTHLREIFYGTLIFQQSSMICIGRHVGGHTLALQHSGQNYFLLISC